MSEFDIYRAGGLSHEVIDSISKQKSLVFDSNLAKFDLLTKEFRKICDLPVCVYDQQLQRRMVPSANQTLVKVENKGFLVIGGSWRPSPTSEALFSKDVFYFCYGSQTLKLVAQLHEPKDTVTAVILHSSLYVLGGRISSSRQVRGQDVMSKLIERIDLTGLMESGFDLNSQEYFENQEFLLTNLLKCEIVELAEDVVAPEVPMLGSAISDERTNSIQIAGGRLHNQMSNTCFRYYLCESPNSNYVRLIEQDQDLNDACCFLDSAVMFRAPDYKKIVCQIGVSRELHILILQMKTTDSGQIQKHISYYHKLKSSGSTNSSSRCYQGASRV